MPGTVCPNGHEVKIIASFCPICGAVMPIPEPVSSGAGGTHCPNGHTFLYKAAFCPTCGSPMYMPVKKSRSPMEQVALGIGVVLFLCIISLITNRELITPESAGQFGGSIGGLIAPVFAACIIAYPLRLLILWFLRTRKPPILLTRRNGWYVFAGLAVVMTIIFSIRILVHGHIF
jgi:ribosomal protein S27AE